MKSRLNLRPDQRGTKKLVEQYGKSQPYVRYHYEEERGGRLKTVEIVVEEKSCVSMVNGVRPEWR